LLDRLSHTWMVLLSVTYVKYSWMGSTASEVMGLSADTHLLLVCF
jgi:hypothetical protein